MRWTDDAQRAHRHGLMRDYHEAMADPDATAEDRRRLHDAVLVACNEPPRREDRFAPSAN